MSFAVCWNVRPDDMLQSAILFYHTPVIWVSISNVHRIPRQAKADSRGRVLLFMALNRRNLIILMPKLKAMVSQVNSEWGADYDRLITDKGANQGIIIRYL